MDMRMLLFASLLACSTSFAQKKSSDTILHAFDDNLTATKKEYAVFTGYAIRNGVFWSAALYDNEAKLVARGSYLNKNCKDKEGWFTFYYPAGNRAASGQYLRDQKDGNWRIWYENGQLRDSIDYVKNLPHGAYYSYFENGQLSGKGIFKNGIEDSTWTWYHANGQISSVEEYVKGKLEGQQCYDESGRKQMTNCALFKEPLTAENLNLRKLIFDRTPLPKDADGKIIEGYATVFIHLSETGELKECQVLKADHPALETLAKQVLTSQTWFPAYNHNRKVPFIRTLQIPFFRDHEPHMDFTSAENTWSNDGRTPALNTGKSAKFRPKFGLGTY